MKITVEQRIQAPIQRVWSAMHQPNDICQWNAPLESWQTSSVDVDFREGGKFSYRMEAKDRSAGFDFAGTYTKIIPYERIEYTLEDDRQVIIEFIPTADAVQIRQTFDAETENSAEQQRKGWQAILGNLARYLDVDASAIKA